MSSALYAPGWATTQANRPGTRESNLEPALSPMVLKPGNDQPSSRSKVSCAAMARSCSWSCSTSYISAL